MPKRDPHLLVRDMLAAVRKIELYIAGLDHAAFLADDKTVDAVVRNLETAGTKLRGQSPVSPIYNTITCLFRKSAKRIEGHR